MKILYICTHNRCRSILSEAITNHYANGKIEARSAGSQPAGEVHPLSLKYLAEAGISTEGLTSQSWDDFEYFEADIVVTVCDSAAGESCPVWFGKSLKVHWGLADPSKLEGSEEELAQAFRETIELIKQRVEALLKLDIQDKEQLKIALANLGASA
ncbi:arsenate reductase ArsC [Paraglaciecola sp. L3A3]|uniref:arsenate reductase ArsC n=1 Tax=Paraglaciecola sp. L3A3 TaxID=2686358 RepID=UPI00131C2BC1|nr:arsenate reductase ArsC [Paraglaciecola sp. L3A3]